MATKRMPAPYNGPPRSPTLREILRTESDLRARSKERESIPLLVELKQGTAEIFTSASFVVDSAFTIDPTFAPVPMRGPSREEALSMASFGVDAHANTQVLRAFVRQPDIEKVLKLPQVVAVWADPEIQPIAADCRPSAASGSSRDVADRLGADRLWTTARTRGAGIVIGIVDGGVDRAFFPVAGGWSPDPSSPPGSSNVAWEGHGNMCAHDALIACPEAVLFDYAIGRTAGPNNACLSAALQAFQVALTSHRLNRTPQVLSNSWGLHAQASDPFPPGDPRNYTHNIAHPFMRKVVEVMNDGVLVSFAAGNALGANGHPRVISVGAVNLRDEWIGYTSQGPSTLADKPDVCSFSHFAGHTACDNGTCAACPVVAGVLGILAAAVPGLTQDRAREALRQTARRSAGTVWNADLGWGVVDALAAYQLPP
ncbi:hypothetical protein BWI17_02005 [Betaproteobacteria bacterium GR16-43]|nr:hypothetical protein BWI17_02005 [Betaproteobacteria bacterium GR16-43]